MRADRLIRPAVFLLLAVPALYYAYAVWLAWTGSGNLLGTDPAQTLALATGEWTIRMLILALAVTPARYLLNRPVLIRYRRMIGLFAFFYACLHFLVFLVFLLGLEWSALGREILERPYITVGFSAFLILAVLAMTSFNRAQRKLGRRWKQLHRLVYVAAALAVIHIVWLVRSDYGEALFYGSLVGVLLLYRVLRRYSQKVRKFSFLPPPGAAKQGQK